MHGVARVRAVGLLSLITLVLATACVSGPAGVFADRVKITVTVRPDGSARINEEFVARFGASPVAEFRRRVPVWRHDGISEIVATMDGQTWPAGDGPGHARVAPGRALDVQWMFAAASDSVHTFTLQYRAAGVVSISGIRGVVTWLALPAARGFDVTEASITMLLPDGAVLLQDPWVEEAGWHVAREPHGMTATRAAISGAESATAGVEFTIDKMTAPTPQWQSDADLTGEFIPAFISAALFILVIGAGVIAMLRFKYPPWPAASNGTRVPAQARRRFQRSIGGGAGEAGWIDAERVSVARDLRIAGVAVLLFGLAVWAVVALAITNFGVWPLWVPWSILIVGGMFLAGASRFDVLSERGARALVLYFERVRDERTPV